MLEDIFDGEVCTRQKNGEIISAKVEFYDELTVRIKPSLITCLRIDKTAELLGINETSLLIIVAQMLLIKSENNKKVVDCVKKYDFGNDEDFANRIITSLTFALNRFTLEDFWIDLGNMKVHELYNLLMFPSSYN